MTTPAKTTPTISDLLTGPKAAEQYALVLPKILTPERFVRCAITAVRKNPKLNNCNRDSVMAAFMTCAELGIEPDGRRAHLIPYGKECQLIIDYKGLLELVMRSGFVRVVHADLVREGDQFEYGVDERGQFLSHRPKFSGERGPIVGAYARAEMTQGGCKVDYMTLDELYAIRDRSRAKSSGPWVTDEGEMMKKTALRRLCKGLPLSPEFRDAMEKDDDRIGDAIPHVQSPVSEVSPITQALLDAQDQEATEPTEGGEA